MNETNADPTIKNFLDVSVRWQDNTFDRARLCSVCRTLCGHPIHEDFYREMGEPDGVAKVLDYEGWCKEVLGETEDGLNEPVLANPDVLTDGEFSSLNITEEQYDMANAAYEQLPPQQKEVWQLVMKQGLSQRQAAEQLGLRPTTVEGYLRRAKASFINYLREHSNG